MPIDSFSANPWENVGRNIANVTTSYEDGYSRMSKALAEEVKARAALDQSRAAIRKSDFDLEEGKRRAQLQTPEFGTRIAGALAGLTEPQTDDLAGYLQRGNWGIKSQYAPLAENQDGPVLPMPENRADAMNAAPSWATPETLQRAGQVRGAQMMSLAGKGDSNADHMAQALARLIGTGREDAALAGQITPEQAQGLNAYRAANAGKLFDSNEAMVVNQATGTPNFNPYYVNAKQADVGLSAARAEEARADAMKKREEANVAKSKVIIGPDGQPTGVRPKMTSTQEKELFEADDFTNAGTNAANMLREALRLNKEAYSGFGAKTRAIVRSNLPGDTPAADATINLDNLMTGQALESLKATFGGAPTEGERKILLDMQASADKTPKQREEILTRAIELADRRIATNKAKAKALRDGTYLTTGFEPGQAQPPAPPKLTAEETRASVLKARKAIADGRDKAEVIRRLEAAGITNHGIK